MTSENSTALMRREHFRRALGSHFYPYEAAWSYCAAERACLRAAGYDVKPLARRVGYGERVR
jgi:hypothetical protein